MDARRKTTPSTARENASDVADAKPAEAKDADTGAELKKALAKAKRTGGAGGGGRLRK
ncbi:MAG TPA: hypothetical protein VFB22_08390 [Candidatus Baltobacteraceae bacterium]|nr:hypothetical protein [Candidatus Baltobacteraceae bacterium]